MATCTATLICYIDPADIKAATVEMEHHFRQFGDPPQPHLVKAAAANLARIGDVIKDCIEVRLAKPGE